MVKGFLEWKLMIGDKYGDDNKNGALNLDNRIWH